jgi:hypothetical protein
MTTIRGTEGGASLPFFSPDGQWIGFFASDVWWSCGALAD